MTQEDFLTVASREYISLLEREKKNPTLAMIEELAAAMKIQPLTFFIAIYAQKNPNIPLSAQIASSLEEFTKTMNDLLQAGE